MRSDGKAHATCYAKETTGEIEIEPIVWRELRGFCLDSNHRAYDFWLYRADESECRARCGPDVNCVGFNMRHEGPICELRMEDATTPQNVGDDFFHHYTGLAGSGPVDHADG